AEGRPGLLDLGRAPFLLALPPLVVDVRADGAERDLLVEVATRPAGSRAAGDGHAPGRGAVRLHLVLKRDEVVPVLGDLVALLLPDRGRVPDQALDSRPGEDLDEVPVDGPEVDPALVVVLAELRHVHDVLQRLDLALLGEAGQQRGAGRGRNIRRAAGRDTGRQDRVLVTGGLELDRDPGLVRERF